MTQDENVNPYPWKQKRREGNFQSKRKQKRKERKFPIKEWEKAKRKERKFPIKEWKKAKRKERKFPTKEWEKVKMEGKKAPDQGSKETRRNVQKGLWTRQYLNNIELSPNEQKEGKETMT